MKKLYFMLATMLLSLVASAQTYPDIYVIGSNVNGKSWATKDPAGKMTMTEPGIYTWTGTTLGTGFKLNDGSWANKKWTSPSGNTVTLNFGSTQKIETDGPAITIHADNNSKDIGLKTGTTVANPTLIFDINNLTLQLKGAASGEVSWYVAGLNDEMFALDDAHKMTKQSDGVYVLEGYELTQKGSFKVATSGWVEKYGNGEGITATVLTNVLTEAGPDDGMTPYDVLGTFDIKWVVATKTISFTKKGEELIPDYYLVGAEIGDKTNSWNPPYADDQKFTNEGDGVYTITVSHLGNSFKINAGSWADKMNTFGAAEGDIIVDEPYSYGIGDAAGNFQFGDNVTSVENATVTLDINDGTVLIEGTPVRAEKEWYLTLFTEGEEFDWNDAIAMPKTSENIYEAKNVTLPSEGTFKISTMNWGEQYGAGAETEPIDGTVMTTTLVPVSIEATVPYELEAGQYDVKWDYENKTVTFTGKSSGIEDTLDASSYDTPVEYYNLQGIRIYEPQGLVIRIQGNKVEKVMM